METIAMSNQYFEQYTGAALVLSVLLCSIIYNYNSRNSIEQLLLKLENKKQKVQYCEREVQTDTIVLNTDQRIIDEYLLLSNRYIKLFE